MVTFQEQVGRRLAAARLLAGLTQGQAAEHVGAPQPLICKYERGKFRTASLEILRSLCRLYGVTSDYVLQLQLQETIEEMK